MLRRRSVSVLNARLTDASKSLRKEVFVLVMVPRESNAAMKDVLHLLRRAEFA